MPQHKLKTARYSRFEHSFEPGECFAIKREKVVRISGPISKRWIVDDLTLPIARIECWRKGNGFAMEFYSMLRDRWSERQLNKDGKIHPCVNINMNLSFWDHWLPFDPDSEEPRFMDFRIDMWRSYQAFRVDYRVHEKDTPSHFEMAVPSLICGMDEVDVSHNPVLTGFFKTRLTKGKKDNLLLSCLHKTKETFEIGSPHEREEVISYFYHFPLPPVVARDLKKMMK